MSIKKFSTEKDFVVGEEKVLNYILAILFFALFLYGVVDAVRKGFRKIDYQSYVFTLAIVPMIYCVKRARNNRVYIRINKKGIYQDEQLVTSWPDLTQVQVTQKKKNSFFNIQDNFILLVDYKNGGKILRRSIPLTNSQNRSEEEVLEAARSFWMKYRSVEN